MIEPISDVDSQPVVPVEPVENRTGLPEAEPKASLRERVREIIHDPAAARAYRSEDPMDRKTRDELIDRLYDVFEETSEEEVVAYAVDTIGNIATEPDNDVRWAERQVLDDFVLYDAEWMGDHVYLDTDDLMAMAGALDNAFSVAAGRLGGLDQDTRAQALEDGSVGVLVSIAERLADYPWMMEFDKRNTFKVGRAVTAAVSKLEGSFPEGAAGNGRVKELVGMIKAAVGVEKGFRGARREGGEFPASEKQEEVAERFVGGIKGLADKLGGAEREEYERLLAEGDWDRIYGFIAKNVYPKRLTGEITVEEWGAIAKTGDPIEARGELKRIWGQCGSSLSDIRYFQRSQEYNANEIGGFFGDQDYIQRYKNFIGMIGRMYDEYWRSPQEALDWERERTPGQG